MSQLLAVPASDLAVAGLDLLGRGLVEKARALAARVQALAPEQAASWHLVTEAARAVGDLEEARRAAARWRALAPDDAEAGVIATLLDGGASVAGYPGLQPVPFLVIDGLLTPERHAEVVAYLAENVVEFAEATVLRQDGARTQDGGARSARVGYEPAAIKSWFQDEVARHLPEASRRFGQGALQIASYELQLTASYHGDFYRAHRDTQAGLENPIQTRRISYVYYFRPPGGDFAGGHLRLYDWRLPAAVATRERFTAIEPRDNRLVIFPSQALHEVMPVQAPGGRWQDGRFTLNGWAHISRAAAAAEAGLQPASDGLVAVRLRRVAQRVDDVTRQTFRASYQAVGEPREVTIPPLLCLLGPAGERLREAAAGLVTRQDAPFVARFRNVEVVGQGLLRLEGEIVESAGLAGALPEDPRERAGYLGRYLLGTKDAETVSEAGARLDALPLRRLEEPLYSLLRPGFDFYGHWLLELVPRLQLARRLGLPPRRWLVARRLPPFALTLLESFGLGAGDLVAFDAFAERLQLADLMLPANGILQHAATPLLEETRVELLRHFGLASPARPWRRFFLSRRAVARERRALTNREAVTAFLAARGFEELQPERLAWREQIRLMTETAAICAEDGSVAHNTLFAPEGTPVLLLATPERRLQYQQAVSALRRQPLGAVAGRARPDAGTGAFEVALEDLAAGLARVCGC